MSSEKRTTTIDDQSIQYSVKESSDATEPRIDVGIHEIAVVLPLESDIDAERLLLDHGDWVLEKKAKFDRYREETPERVFESGEEWPFLGELYELAIEQRSASQIDNDVIRLAAHHVEQTSVRQALKQFYRRKAREIIQETVDMYADEMEVEYDRLEIRNQRTKWGSCSSSGTLGINWRLIMAPMDILEYVVIHELAHLQEANHTKAFWSLVAEHDPGYMDHAEWLDENSTRLIFTEEDL